MPPALQSKKIMRLQRQKLLVSHGQHNRIGNRQGFPRSAHNTILGFGLRRVGNRVVDGNVRPIALKLPDQ